MLKNYPLKVKLLVLVLVLLLSNTPIILYYIVSLNKGGFYYYLVRASYIKLLWAETSGFLAGANFLLEALWYGSFPLLVKSVIPFQARVAYIL